MCPKARLDACVTEPFERLFGSLCTVCRHAPQVVELKRWPPAATYFAIKRCQIAQNPRAVYGFPFGFLIR
jgi:hypothetical protein